MSSIIGVVDDDDDAALKERMRVMDDEQMNYMARLDG